MQVKLKVSIAQYENRPAPDGGLPMKVVIGASRKLDSDRTINAPDGNWDQAKELAQKTLEADGWKVRSVRVLAGTNDAGLVVPKGLTAVVEPGKVAPSRKVR